MRTTFWDLYPDIIIEISHYFTINELLCSFYPYVLPNLFEILNESHVNLHLCLTNDNLLMNKILSLINNKQVISLEKLSGSIPIQLFQSIKTLTLNNSPNMANSIIEASKLPFLQQIIIVSSNYLKGLLEYLLRCIFTKTSIKYLKLNLNNHDLLSLGSNVGKSCSIDQLIINATCSLSTINTLLDNLPCLRIFYVRTIMDSSIMRLSTIKPSQHSSLKILELGWYHPSMDVIVKLLTKCPNLKQYKMTGIIISNELNGKLWDKLITETCLNIKRMTINMQIWIRVDAEDVIKKFNEDTFFQRLGFQLLQNKNEEQLFTFFGNFERSIE